MSFIDFYNNINAIQIFSLDTDIGGSLASIVPLNGKLHESVIKDGATIEFYFKGFHKSKVRGHLRGVFSADIEIQHIKTKDMTEPMIAVQIYIIDDDEIG